MLFNYRLLNAQGKMLRGKIEAKNKTEASQILTQQNCTIIALNASIGWYFSTVNALKIREKAHFCFCLHQLLSAGVPLHDALFDLTQSDDFSPLMQSIFIRILATIENGETFSCALKNLPKHFSPIFVAMIEAGETSGTLPEVLQQLYQSLIWQENLRQKRQRLFFYPALLSLAVGSVFIFLMLFLVPQLKRFVEAMHFQLPWYSTALFALADFLKNQALLLFFLGSMAVILLILLRRFFPLLCAKAVLSIPFLGKVLKKIALARFAQTAALLYSSGIPILETFAFTQNVLGNAALEKDCALARLKINQGENLANAFRQSQFFTPLVIRMLAVGEKTGALDCALNHVKNFYMQEADESTQRLHAAIEPFLTLTLGTLLLWVVLAVLEPIYQILGQIL